MVGSVSFDVIWEKWQLGQWDAVPRHVPRNLKRDSRRAEIAVLVGTAYFQLGLEKKAQLWLRHARWWGVSENELVRLIVAGAENSLGRAALLLGDARGADACFDNSVKSALGARSCPAIATYRKRREIENLESEWCRSRDLFSDVNCPIPFRRLGADVGNYGLFIDCGGYDGCSVIKFLASYPDFEVVSFEPNPEMHSYYDELPTTLVKKAAYTYDGTLEFLVDPLDGDGSTLVKDKAVDCKGQWANQDCPQMVVECLDLSEYIRDVAKSYQTVILKLDIEGAEYDVLEKLLQDGSLRYVDLLMCEFHWDKANITQERHDHVYSDVTSAVPVQEWDALEFAIHKKPRGFQKTRESLLTAIRAGCLAST